jgi:hypothetical protein
METTEVAAEAAATPNSHHLPVSIKFAPPGLPDCGLQSHLEQKITFRVVRILLEFQFEILGIQDPRLLVLLFPRMCFIV